MKTGARAVRLPILVIPRAHRDEIVGVMDNGRLKVRVTAAPVGGAANRAVQRILARALALKPENVEIVLGKSSRRKLFRVSGLKDVEVHARLGLPV